MKSKFLKMWKSERKEHTSFTNKQITQIVKDHFKMLKQKGVK